MPHRMTFRPRLRSTYKLFLELLEDRLPPGDLFWGTSGLVSGASLETPALSPTSGSQVTLGLLASEVAEQSAGLLLEAAGAFPVEFAPAAQEESADSVRAAPAGDPWEEQQAQMALSGGLGQAGSSEHQVGPGTDGFRGSNGGSSLGGSGATPGIVPAGDSLFTAVNSVEPIHGLNFGGGTIQAVVDLTITNVEVTQAIQRLNNSVGLVAGKATMARIYVGLNGSTTPVREVYGAIYVYENGVEVPGSPFYAYNGPITAQPNPNRGVENATLNVMLPALSGFVELAPVVWAWGDDEANWDDNFSYSPHSFECRQSPSLSYIPTDYRPTGGTIPNLPNPAMIAPGVGDRFVQAIYPVISPNYFQISGAPLLWTQNINTSTAQYFNALNQRREMTSPRPDYLYGWLPGNPFSGNGAAMIGGRVSFGNTELSRYIRTYAHELGHNVGLSHNSRRIVEVGIDVENSIGLGRIKAATLNDIMVPGLLTNVAFVDVATYTHFYNHPMFQCSDGPKPGNGTHTGGDYLFVTGLIDEAGRATLNPVYRLQGPREFTQSDPTGVYAIQVHTSAGQAELRFNVDAHAEDVEGEMGRAFSLAIPNDSGIQAISLLHQGQSQDVLLRSAHAPVGGFAVAPGVLSGATTLGLNATDADGDQLTYSIQYSPDGGRTLVPIVVSGTGTQFTVNAEQLPASTNGLLRLLITDGLNTTTIEQSVAVVSSLQQS